jgi:bzd-type benzoyl-CoA reductase Q subunit
VKESSRAWRWLDKELLGTPCGELSAGVDVGSVSTQAVVLAGERLLAWSSIRTGYNSPQSASRALELALEDTGIVPGAIVRLVGTGYGRVNVPGARRTVTEIACHARGAVYMYGPRVRTVLDMGGQDCKVIRCDERGRVENFLMNDKCAAGTGRGLEVFAEVLEVPLERMGELSLEVDREPEPVSSTCVVFARSEAAALLRRGWSRQKVLAAYCASVARRVVQLIQAIGLERELAVTGGIAKNRGVMVRLERLLGVKALVSSWDTQLAGALGAALFARELT